MNDPLDKPDPSALVQVAVTLLMALGFMAVVLAWAH